MNVLVERCYHGNDVFSHRFTVQSGKHFRQGFRFHVYEDDKSDREISGQARDILECETGVKRNSIKLV